MKFSIPRYTNISLNVTMLNPVVNYTLGRPEFIIENYTLDNSLIAKIKPYPCCDIKNISLQTAEICS